jgi:ribosomal-protein-alanine N-acetyltransferase
MPLCLAINDDFKSQMLGSAAFGTLNSHLSITKHKIERNCLVNREHNWRLRRVADSDIDALYELMCIPLVYRYLADNVVPPRAVLEHWVERSHLNFNQSGVGLWLLENHESQLAGCVRLDPDLDARSAELTYVLHPQVWGLGLATRMSWTVMQLAFSTGNIDRIIAGADEPNVASLAVMQRLGMTFLRTVQYPLGPGREYVFHGTDAAPSPEPELIPEH